MSYLRFEEGCDAMTMPIIIIFNKRENYKVGYIEFDEEWKKWVFCPEANMKFCSMCQREILAKTEEMNKRGG